MANRLVVDLLASFGGTSHPPTQSLLGFYLYFSLSQWGPYILLLKVKFKILTEILFTENLEVRRNLTTSVCLQLGEVVLNQRVGIVGREIRQILETWSYLFSKRSQVS